jgi:5,10-methylene-tetrahydrofolate dehydrogenase/methenyl tetrahydrofolate cyclohydrolase
MYNQTTVFKGGYALSHQSISDTSHFLTLTKGNHLYVNEVGDDSKNGTLDMKGNKIINVAIPIDSDDSTNKKYVDSQNAETKNLVVNDFISRRNVFIESQTFQKEIDMRNNKIINLSSPSLPADAVNKLFVDERSESLRTHITSEVKLLKEEIQKILKPDEKNNNVKTELERIINAKNGETRTYIDNHKWSGESITTGTINIERLPVKQYGVILNIGPSSTNQKTTTHSIKLPLHSSISYKKINLQLTLIQETRQFTDDIFSSIKNYDVENIPDMNSHIMVVVDTHRSSKEFHWDNHLKAHLLITIFETEMITIENNP